MHQRIESSSEYLLSSEIFMRSVHDDCLVYSPLKKIAFLANQPVVDFIRTIQNNQINAAELTPDHTQLISYLQDLHLINSEADQIPIKTYPPLPTQLMILPTANCNLRCSYCFSNGGEAIISVSEVAAKAAVDRVVKNVAFLKEDLFSLSFHGGGEPTLAWKLLTSTTDYARKYCEQLGLNTEITMVSNGLWTNRQLQWIVKNIDRVTLSLDGPEELNNQHRLTADGRSSFPYVMRTVAALNEKGYPIRTRSTITNKNVNFLPEMVDFFDSLGVKVMQFEPLTHTGRAITSQCQPPDPEIFIDKFQIAWERAYWKKLILTCSGVRIQRFGEIFCSAAGTMFCLTPDEYVTSCHRISSINDPQSDVFYYGKYNQKSNRYDIDEMKLNKLKEFRMQNSLTCHSCLAKWHCAGGCYEQNLVWSHHPQHPAPYRCQITQELTARKLEFLIKEQQNKPEQFDECI